MIVKNSRLLAGLLCLAAAWVLMGFTAPQQNVKATWVWQTEMIEDGGKQLLQFAGQKGINLIYLQINRNESRETYESFIKNAHANNVAVHALGGDPKWALTEYRDGMLGLVDWVKNYNTNASPDAQFDGIHLDVEPYVLPQWEIDPDAVISSWVPNLQSFLDEASRLPDVELGIDLPFWFEPYVMPGSDTPLTEWIMKSFDHVTILAYRNNADAEHGIVGLAQDELQMAERLGKKVLVGVNTKEMPGESYTSFHGSTQSQMNDVLTEVTDAFHSYSSFTGIAIHDFRYWENMPPGDEDNGDPGTAEPDPGKDPDPAPPEEGDPVPDPSPVNREKMVRGTYIWEANEVLEHSQDILEFAKEKKLNWLYVRLDLQQPFDAYRSFVKQAHDAGIEVHAMGGHPIWALTESRPKMMKLVNYVKDYNRTVTADERFHGIHLDIEPYVLPEWWLNTDEVIREWTGNLEAFTNELKKDSNLQASMDLATWIDRYQAPGSNMSLSKWFIKKMDHVSLMAFRDTVEGSNGILALTKEEQGFAEELGKPLLYSVEMKESHEGDHITFYEEGSAYMEEALLHLSDKLSGYSSYAGNLVHAYDYWKNAKP